MNSEKPLCRLSPEHSMIALDLAWRTVGTADVPDTVVHAWVAELLTNPVWGVLRYARITAHKAILDNAELHRAAAAGDMPPVTDWDAAGRAAHALAATLDGSGMRAAKAAYESTRFVDDDALMALDEVGVHVQNAYALASGVASTPSRVTVLTGHAIRSWRQLAELDVAEPCEVSPALLAVRRSLCPYGDRPGCAAGATHPIHLQPELHGRPRQLRRVLHA